MIELLHTNQLFNTCQKKKRPGLLCTVYDVGNGAVIVGSNQAMNGDVLGMQSLLLEILFDTALEVC